MGLLPVLPASAALNGTASITSTRSLFAGRQSDISFRFNNPTTSTGGLIGETQPTMNRIQIVPAPGFTISCPSAAPGSWSCLTTSKGVVRFSIASGGIAPGTNQSFDVTANAGRPGNDQTRTWQVQMSPDNGDSFVDPDASTPGALDTTVRILQVTNVLIGAPAGAMDNTVTSGQNNAFVDVTVLNGGSADKETTATLTSPSGSDGVRGAPPAAQTIAGFNGMEDDATFRFGFNFGNTGTRRLTGDASALGADAFELQGADITVQTPIDITYAIGSLTPLASRSGELQTFDLSFNKTGEPSGRDLAGTLTLQRNDAARSFSANLSSPNTYDGGSASVGHSFGPVEIPGDADAAGTGGALDFDGDYNLSASISGVDGNDATVQLTESISDIFTIDNLVPLPVPTLSAPNRVAKNGATRAANNADTNQPYVARNGQTLTIGGDIFKSGSSGQLDTTAQVVKCELRVYNEAGVQVQNIPVPRANCREDGLGHLTGSVSVADFMTPTGRANLYVEVADRVPGNVGFNTSNNTLVDNVVPDFGSGRTGCRGLSAAECAGGELRTIQVFWTEPITGTFLAPEFTCQDQIVTGASFSGNGMTYGDRVVLTVAQDMDVDEQPTCEYVRAPAQAAPVDAPTNALPSPIDLTIVDDIAPDLPSITTVNGNTAYSDDGLFYTNDSTPEVALAGLRSGYTGIVARETNGTDGYQFGFDQELCRFGSDGEGGSCSTSDLGGDATKQLYAASLDARGNVSFDKDGVQVGNGNPFQVALDRVAPRAATAVVDMTARTLIVDFDEKLDAGGDQQAPDPAMRGRNSAQDWTIFVITAEGESRTIKPGTVANGAAFDQKVVTVNANTAGWTGSTVTAIEYSVEDDDEPSRRYEDRAGNDLLDFPPGPRPTIT
jgi:hypothetical protein